MIWVVNYNAVACHIYSYDRNLPVIRLVKEITDPRNRGHKDPKEVEVDHFSKEVADLLEHGRTNHEYDELVVIGPPHMNGLLFKHVTKSVKELVTQEIQKDFQNYTAKELLEYLKKHVTV
jgi:protein required for attachment to host cells